MVDNQIPVPDLNRIIDELMSEHRHGVKEVHLEPSTETVMNAEPETHPEMEEPIEEERAGKRQRVVEQTEEGGSEEDKDFVSIEAKDIWTKVLADKSFVCERGFGKLKSPCSEIIKKRG